MLGRQCGFNGLGEPESVFFTIIWFMAKGFSNTYDQLAKVKRLT
jgi:hypothetical protein